MSKVKRFDHVNHAHIDDCEHVESSEGAWVTASDYDALAAKLAMAEDAAAKGDAARQQCGGMEMEIEELRAELAELRARVVVVPEHKDDLPPIYEDENLPAFHHYKGWNACLDELARLNGLTVSEALLRRLCEPLLSHADYVVARNELRALLGEEKEHE
ncbi:TPA: hypothetical protein N2C23_006107 [Pseudomonas aeruginosa]|nr:hypothetical protein [Pseudomonas aeruginosa]HCL4179190.1 hypothetical protein [Pseudomonas aeruginosa]